MLQHLSILHSFLLRNHSPFHGYSTFYVSIYQLMGVEVIFTFWLLLMLLLFTSIYKSLCEYIFISLGYIPKNGIAKSYSNFIYLFISMETLCLTFWKSAKNVFQRDYTNNTVLPTMYNGLTFSVIPSPTLIIICFLL